jgi:hypothetical protein
MAAKIIGQNHKVISYEVTNKHDVTYKRFVVEDIVVTANRRYVNEAIAAVGREWSKVYNYLSDHLGDGGFDEDYALHRTIERMTY